MSDSISTKSSFSSTQSQFRNQSNEPKPIDSLQNDITQNSIDSKPFARVNSNRQSIVKNENGFWSSGSLIGNESNMYTITLINTNQTPGPLGIHVIPTFNSISQRDMGMIIQRIEPGGRVHRDGRLQVGDRLIEINRKNLIGLGFVKCQDILREAISQSSLTQNGLLEFKIFRPANNFNLEGTKQNHEQKEDQSCNKDNNFKSNSINLGALNTKKMGTKINVKLVKGSEGLGFKLSARDYCNPGEFSPIYIKNILPVGAALKDGRLQRGDRLLEVNNIDMTQKTLHEAVSILRDTNLGDAVDIVVSRQMLDSDTNPESESSSDKATEQKLDNSLSTKDQNPKRQKFTFKIKVACDSLGISVKGKTKRLEESENLVDLGVYVKAVIDGGAASRDGRVRLNDQIININGCSLLGKSNEEAMNILKDGLHREIEPGLVEITVSRKINAEAKSAKRDESLSPVKSALKQKHANRKSDEYGDAEQFSRFNRDAPSRRSVSEKRAKAGDITNGYATFGKHLRNQSLNDHNPKRSNTLQIIQSQNNSCQTLGRPAKLLNQSQNEYLVPQNVKSASMESIPICQYNKRLFESKCLNNSKIEALNSCRNDLTSSQVGDIDSENSNMNRLNPKNRSFLTAIDKSREKLDKTTEDIELGEVTISSKIDMSKMEKPTIKKSSESFRHKSLIGKFQNLLKSTYNKKIQNTKSDKNHLDPKSNEKSNKKSNTPAENQNLNTKEPKSTEKITVMNNSSDDFLLENDTLYKQYIPSQNQSNFVSNSVQALNEIQSNLQSNFANRESVYYQSIDNSNEYFLEQKKILREKQKKILEQQQKYYQENDRQPRCVARNSSIFQQYRPLAEANEKIHLSAPFNASAQSNLVSDLIREQDFTHRYFPETASTTSSIMSTSSAYTTSSAASEQQNQQLLSSQYEFQNFSHITNITQV